MEIIVNKNTKNIQILSCEDKGIRECEANMGMDNIM